MFQTGSRRHRGLGATGSGQCPLGLFLSVHPFTRDDRQVTTTCRYDPRPYAVRKSHLKGLLPEGSDSTFLLGPPPSLTQREDRGSGSVGRGVETEDEAEKIESDVGRVARHP